jgi:hypothetical protein
MADDSETLKVRMLRVTGKNDTIQWFEYRPSFRVDIVRIEWELDTMDVELDSPVADYLLRAGYAAPVAPGSAPKTAETPAAPKITPAAPPSPPPAPVKPKQDVIAEEPAPPPPAPSWLKPSGE